MHKGHLTASSIIVHKCLAPLKLKYRECGCYGKRSAHICFRCGYCYSCHAKGGRDREEKDPSEPRPEPDRHREPSPLALALQSLYPTANSLAVLEIFCRVRRLEVRQLGQWILPLGARPKGVRGLLFKSL